MMNTVPIHLNNWHPKLKPTFNRSKTTNALTFHMVCPDAYYQKIRIPINNLLPEFSYGQKAADYHFALVTMWNL